MKIDYLPDYRKTKPFRFRIMPGGVGYKKLIPDSMDIIRMNTNPRVLNGDLMPGWRFMIANGDRSFKGIKFYSIVYKISKELM